MKERGSTHTKLDACGENASIVSCSDLGTRTLVRSDSGSPLLRSRLSDVLLLSLRYAVVDDRITP